MTCTNCGTENRAGRKFCSECGTVLAVGCPNCGVANEPGERFCGECGNALAGESPAVHAAPSSLAGAAARMVAAGKVPDSAAPAGSAQAERRLVSVLFADLVGFTPFAEERDAEDVRETLSRYFEICSEVIARYGGVVEKFIGDAVMAVWGAPTAKEDDPERAVRAALELVDSVKRLGQGIQLRAGVLTGEAAVTIGATNQGMVAGDIVNTAARLQSAAPPGRVLVGESTFRGSSKAIAFEEAGEQVLKGKAAPVRAWLALRVVAEVGGRNRAGGLEAPFVGRDEELRLLKDLFHAAARERRTRLVSVIGPGGIGKSRLAWEFEKYLDGIVTTVRWHHGRSPAYGQGISFWALGEMIRGRAGLAETDDEATTRERIGTMLATVVDDESERRWLEPAFLTLLGITTKEIPRDELFSAWRMFFDRLALSGPVVLVFEDLHWADGGLLDFIDHLLEWSREQPIYVLTLARPELIERRPDWGAGRRNFMSLGLEPLSKAAMSELLAGLVPGLPGPTMAAIVARADGMPLYAVETVRMLVADGRLREHDGVYALVGDITSLAIPETLTALVGARLDALDPIDRGLLQDAAVLGQTFTLGGLTAVSGRDTAQIEPRLNGLTRREILASRSDPRSPERGQFAFMQALIREVAYNTLTKKDRRDRHLAAARFFEAIATDELAGALAGHYLSAYENSPAGPEADGLAIQARLALVAAADRAATLGSSAQALTFLEQAMTIDVQRGHEPELLERATRQALKAGRYQRALEHAQAGLAAFIERGDRPGEARMIVWVARAMGPLLQVHEAQAMVAEAVPRFDDLYGRPEHVALVNHVASWYFMANEVDAALAWADRALQEAERFDLVPSIVDGLVTKGGALGYMGRGYEGISTLRGAAALAEAHGYQIGVLLATTNLSDAQIARDPRAGLETARSGLELAKRVGGIGFLTTMVTNGVYMAHRTGDWDWAGEAVADLLSVVVDETDHAIATLVSLMIAAGRGEAVAAPLIHAERILNAGSDKQMHALVRDISGIVAFADGRLEKAYSDETTAAMMMGWLAPTAYLVAARAALWLGDTVRARAVLDLLAATTHGPAIAAGRATIEAGLLALAGDRSAALAAYRPLIGNWLDIGLKFDAALTGIDMAILLGPPDPAVSEAAATAREILTALGARPFLERLEAAMASSAAAPAAAASRAPAVGASDAALPAAPRASTTH